MRLKILVGVQQLMSGYCAAFSEKKKGPAVACSDTPGWYQCANEGVPVFGEKGMKLHVM